MTKNTNSGNNKGGYVCSEKKVDFFEHCRQNPEPYLAHTHPVKPRFLGLGLFDNVIYRMHIRAWIHVTQMLRVSSDRRTTAVRICTTVVRIRTAVVRIRYPQICDFV